MMTILASRERFCLHPDIATAPNKTEACEGATMVGHMDCTYLENAEASWYPQVLCCCILFSQSSLVMHGCQQSLQLMDILQYELFCHSSLQNTRYSLLSVCVTSVELEKQSLLSADCTCVYTAP